MSIPEVGPEGDNGAFYAPTSGQPGFIDGVDTTYHFISDTPEPRSLALLMPGGLPLLGFLRRRRA